jgi:hypothetical protein
MVSCAHTWYIRMVNCVHTWLDRNVSFIK